MSSWFKSLWRILGNSEALDYLLDEGHVTTDDEAMMYKAVDPKGKRPVYGRVDEW